VTGANSAIGLATTLLWAHRVGDLGHGAFQGHRQGKALTEAATAAKVEALVQPLVLHVSDDKAVVRRWSEAPTPSLAPRHRYWRSPVVRDAA
jgi:hypothetical protein